LKETAFLLCSCASGFVFHYYLWAGSLPELDNFIDDQEAVLTGEIVSVSKTTNGNNKYLIEGSLDAERLPRINNTRVQIISSKLGAFIPGERIRANGRFIIPTSPNLPGEFDSRSYYLSQGCVGLLLPSSLSIDYTRIGSEFLNKRTGINRGLDYALKKELPKRHYPVMKAMLLGDKTAIDGSLRDSFSNAGTAHLLAVSGLHTGIIAAAIYFLLSGIKRRWVKLIIFAAALSVFIVLSGTQPSAVRAGIMAVMFLWAHGSERAPHPINLLSFAVILALLFQPELVFSIGFRMSVLAMLGILFTYKPILDLLSFLRYKWIKASIAISLSSSIFLSIYIAYVFGIYSVISPLANFIVVPLISVAMALSVIGQLFYQLIPVVASYYFSASSFILDIGLIANEAFAMLSWASVTGEMAMSLALMTTLVLLALLVRVSPIYRLGIAGLGLFSLLPTPMSENHYHVNRPYVYLYEEHGSLPILIDKRYNTRPTVDFGLLNYLEARIDQVDTVLITGLHSMAITDRLRKSKNDLVVVEIDTAIQRRIIKQANIDLFSTSINNR
jgi:ComEC/Rec2-related protein